MVWLVGHVAGSVMAATPPVFTPSDFGFAIRAGLFDAEGQGDNGVGVWEWFEVGCVFVAL